MNDSAIGEYEVTFHKYIIRGRRRIRAGSHSLTIKCTPQELLSAMAEIAKKSEYHELHPLQG
jgi:hypothetical protein